MKINIPFGLNDILTNATSRLAAEKNTPRGVWPLQMNNVWHTAIHLKPYDSKNTYIESILPGKIMASRLSTENKLNPINNEQYSTSFVLMQHYFSFGSTKVPFYILYSNLASKTFIDNNELLISKLNMNNAEVFRPIFFKKWKLNINSIKKEKLKIIEYYDNPSFSGNPKGYLNRDSKIFIHDTPTGKYFKKNGDENKYYIKNLSALKEITSSTYYTLAKTTDTTYNQEVNVYYNTNKIPENIKFSFYLKDKNIFLKAKPLDNGYMYIKFPSKEYVNKFYNNDFYITTNQKYNVNDKLLIKTNTDLGIITNTNTSTIATTTIGGFTNYVNCKNVPFFKGDVLQILESINSVNNMYQYKVKKLYANCDIDKDDKTANFYQQGYIENIADLNSIFSTIKTYEIRNYDIQNLQNLYEMDNMVKVYDKPDVEKNNGITLYPFSQINEDEVYEIIKKDDKYYVLIKLKALPNYYNSSLIVSGNNRDCFYGYVELDSPENLSNCIIPEYRKIGSSLSHETENVISDDFENAKSNYNSIIGYYDGENNLDLHLELFFTSLDEFVFKKNKKSFNGDNIEEFIEINAQNNIYKALNSVLLGKTKYKNTVNKKYKFSIKGASLFEMLYVREQKYIEYTSLEKNFFKGYYIILDNNELRVRLINKDNKQYLIFKKDFKNEKYDFKKGINYEITDNSIIVLGEEEITNLYIIVSDISDKSSNFELSENNTVYTGQILLTPIEDKVKVFLDKKSFLYFNCDDIQINNTSYTRFNSNGNYYFIKNSDINTKKISNQYQISEQKEQDGDFKDLESSIKFNVSDLPNFILVEEKENTEIAYSDYLCDIQNIINSTKLGEYLLKSANQTIDINKLKEEGLFYSEIIYSNSSLYNELSKLIIKCPSMWEEPKNWNSKKDDYLKETGYLGLVNKPQVQDYIKNQFIFKTGSQIKKQLFNTDTTQYYYFHPLRFLEFYSKTHQEYCPYFGEIMYDFPSDSVGGVSFVKDNIGFAPYAPDDRKRAIYDGYVTSNGHFNEDYSKVHPTYGYYYHEGVDFAVASDTEIHSFIYGQVIDYGDHVTMGGYLLIEDLFVRKKYYLLLHIRNNSWNSYGVKKGTIVYPGMIVANSFRQYTSSTAFHLHVSVIQLDPNNPNEIPIPDPSLPNVVPIIRTVQNNKIVFPIWDQKYKDKMRNPFNHDETWGGRL